MQINPPDIASIISQKLGITFLLNLDSGLVPRGNVCFAQGPELRPEYRETFTLEDIIDYLFGILHGPFKKGVEPADANMFWEMVKIGNVLQRNSKKIYVPDQSSIKIKPELKHNRVIRINLDGTGKIWINDLQFLDGVPPQSWKLCLDGKSPAKQWLKNYMGKELGANELGEFRILIEQLNKVCRSLDDIENPT